MDMSNSCKYSFLFCSFFMVLYMDQMYHDDLIFTICMILLVILLALGNLELVHKYMFSKMTVLPAYFIHAKALVLLDFLGLFLLQCASLRYSIACKEFPSMYHLFRIYIHLHNHNIVELH